MSRERIRQIEKRLRQLDWTSIVREYINVSTGGTCSASSVALAAPSTLHLGLCIFKHCKTYLAAPDLAALLRLTWLLCGVMSL